MCQLLRLLSSNDKIMIMSNAFKRPRKEPFVVCSRIYQDEFKKTATIYSQNIQYSGPDTNR